MKSFLVIFSLSAVLLTASCSKDLPSEPTPQQPAETVNWVSYEQGLTLAKATGKPVYIDFTADWCIWCVRMDLETFSDPAVARMLNEHFVPIRLDVDSQRKMNVNGRLMTEDDIAKYIYLVRGIPTSTFLESDGNLISTLPGYRAPYGLIPLLQIVKDKRYISQQDLMPAIRPIENGYSPLPEAPNN